MGKQIKRTFILKYSILSDGGCMVSPDSRRGTSCGRFFFQKSGNSADLRIPCRYAVSV